MSELSEHSDEEIFSEYTDRCKKVAGRIAEHLNDNLEHESVNGSDWCEEHDVPETVFEDAVVYHLGNINYGISSMYPFRSGGEAYVVGGQNDVFLEEDLEESEEEMEVEEDGE